MCSIYITSMVVIKNKNKGEKQANKNSTYVVRELKEKRFSFQKLLGLLFP